MDIADVALPLLDGPARRPPSLVSTASCSSPEYDDSVPAALTNAIDYLFAERGRKPGGFVS